MKTSNQLQDFINNRIQETIKLNISAFHLNEIKCLGILRVDKNVQELFTLTDNKTYDIYLKLKNPISDCHTRLILTKITSDNYS